MVKCRIHTKINKRSTRTDEREKKTHQPTVWRARARSLFRSLPLPDMIVAPFRLQVRSTALCIAQNSKRRAMSMAYFHRINRMRRTTFESDDYLLGRRSEQQNASN